MSLPCNLDLRGVYVTIKDRIKDMECNASFWWGNSPAEHADIDRMRHDMNMVSHLLDVLERDLNERGI